MADNSKCKLGVPCDSYNRCGIHRWSHDHDDAMLGIWITVIIVVAVFVAIIIIDTWNDMRQPTRTLIEGLNCMDLAEYIADKNKEYNYAEHRYEWLCINEQVKEFRG